MSEYGKPGHAERVPGGRCPLMWAQGLYIIGKLLHEEFIAPGELDPMNRYLLASSFGREVGNDRCPLMWAQVSTSSASFCRRSSLHLGSWTL